MKTLKITLLLVAVLLLTVSGVKSENTSIASDEQKATIQPTKIDLIAHAKNKLKKPSNGG